MKKIYTEEQFNNLIKNAVKETLKCSLNEYFNPMEGFDDFSGDLDFDAHNIEGDDEYENELVRSMDKKNRKDLGLDDKNSSGNFFKDVRGLDKRVSNKNDADFEDDIWGMESSETDIEHETENMEDNELFIKALEDIENDNGRTKMEAWVAERVSEGTDEKDAEEAFKAAKAEYSKESSEYATDYASSFDNREVEKPAMEHHAGNVIDYEGVEIKDDGKQFIMTAKTSDPLITIKGSDIEEVKKTYDKLWRDVGSMEDRARKMGLTLYHDALLKSDDYDTYVRSVGGHEEGLPIIIDLDKMKNNYTKTPSEKTPTDSTPSWLAPYKHEINNKYMLTPYQLSRLTPEQRAEWNRLTKMYPAQYTTYAEAPSIGKINRYKKEA